MFISGASPLLRLLLFLLPSTVEGKSKLELIPESLCNLIVVTTFTHPTVVTYIWTHTHTHTHTHMRTVHTHDYRRVCSHTQDCKCMFSTIHRSTSHHVILQCRFFFPSPTPNQPSSLFYSLSAQVTAEHNNTPADICLS